MPNFFQRPATRLGALLAVAGILTGLWAGDTFGWIGTPTAESRPEAGIAKKSAELDTAISNLQDRLRLQPDWADGYTQLGDAYLQKARENGDPTYYGKAEGVLKKANELKPDDPLVISSLGNLALSRHQFAAGLELGERAKVLAPYSAYPYGIIGDALVELGRYDEALDAFQSMVDKRPNLASFSRASYAHELYGDLSGAKDLMARAAGTGVPGTESRSWTLYQLGLLQFTTGDLQAASGNFDRAEAEFPGYVYALAGQARIASANGDYAKAAGLLEKATSRMPLPEFVILLGDTYQAAGRQADADRQYALVRVMTALFASNGVDTDLELAIFDLDHTPNPSATLEQLKVLYANRPTTKAADALAWAYYLTGDIDNARIHAAEALRLGSQDPNMLYHAGKIAAAAGQKDEARRFLGNAMRLNPRYSLLYSADLAKSYQELG